MESCYANIERELLAVVFACIRFNTYLQGRKFTVQSDHKPLEVIHLKSMHNAPPRLQRMLLQLQKYDMKIEYKPGSEMLLADALSRCPARYSQEIKLDLCVDYIAFTSAWIETLKETTCEDLVLSTVYQLVQHGWPKERRRVPNVAKYYWDFRDELSTDEGLLLKGPSLIIPAALRENYLQRLHEGHLSASKTITNARQHMFWPGIEADIKDYTRCQVCIKRSRPAREPLQPHEIPDGPWQKLGMDFFDLKGKCYILICDYFSKFPFMFSCKTSWGSLKDRLIDLFSNKGFPKEIISDNGSPFNSQEFTDYLSSHGVKHTTSSPHYPQSNGFIECHIQTVKNLLYKAMDARTRSFQEVLSELRATKIGNNLPSPAEILHGRSLITGKPVTVDHAKVKAVLVGRQIKDSQQYNKSHRVKSQRTLVLGERCWGTGTNNEWLDCHIAGIDKENRCYWVVFEDTGRCLKRTRSHLRPRRPDFPHISERFLQQNAALSETSVLSGREGETEANNQEISVLSGPPLNSEQDTAVDFVSDAPSERAITFNDNPVAGTRYIPLRLRDTPQEPRPLPAELPFDPMTPAANAIPRPETAEHREEDHDNVPDTGPSTNSSVADTSGTSESGPGSSSTTGTDEMTDKASSETSGSSSSSDGSTESDSAPSTPPSPRRTSTLCTEEAMSAKVPSGPPSPSLADSSLEVRQILRDQAGHALTHSQYQKQTNAAKQRATVLKRVAQLDINQLPLPKPGEPQPGPSRESNGASRCVQGKQRDSTATSSDEEE